MSNEQIETIAVGDYVRSYDFPGLDNDSCYIEGTVREMGVMMEGCQRYRIRVERVVRDNKEIQLTGEESDIYPPVNGTPSWLGGVTNGVKKIERPNK